MGDTLPPKGNLREGFEAKVSQYTIKDRILKLVVETSARNVDLNNLAELQNCSVIVGLFEQQIPMKMGGDADEEDEQLDSFRQTTSAYGGGKQCAAYLEAAEGVEKRCLHNEGHEGLHRNMDGTGWGEPSDADAMVSQAPSDEGWYFRIGENDERGPFPGPIEAAEAIGLIKQDLEASQLPSFVFTDPYQKSTGELGGGVDPIGEQLPPDDLESEERPCDEEIAETAAAYAETPEGEMDQAREDALFGKEIDTELGADVAAQIQADRMSQFAPTDEQKVADVFAQIDARGEPAQEPEEETYQRDDDGSTRIKKGRRSRAAA